MTNSICVWYWFIFLPYVCPFLIFLCWTINWWPWKQNIMWLRQSVHKRKAETVQSDTVRYYHRSKLCCLGICVINLLYLFYLFFIVPYLKRIRYFFKGSNAVILCLSYWVYMFVEHQSLGSWGCVQERKTLPW